MAGGNAAVLRLLGEQRKRCLATILTSAETSDWWLTLTGTERTQFRDQIRSALSVFYDLVRDVIKVTEDDGVRNELALELIRAIHTQQTEITDALRRSDAQPPAEIP